MQTVICDTICDILRHTSHTKTQSRVTYMDLCILLYTHACLCLLWCTCDMCIYEIVQCMPTHTCNTHIIGSLYTKYLHIMIQAYVQLSLSLSLRLGLYICTLRMSFDMCPHVYIDLAERCVFMHACMHTRMRRPTHHTPTHPCSHSPTHSHTADPSTQAHKHTCTHAPTYPCTHAPKHPHLPACPAACVRAHVWT